MRCGLLGRSLKHSYSPQIHEILGSYSYDLFEQEPESLSDFFKHCDFKGINVTIPYKKDVVPYCDELSPIAKELGSVNTIVRAPDGRLIGHNSDYFGFLSMVRRTGISISGKKVLVLGSGGASVTVCAVLNSLNAHVVQISRKGPNHYGNLHLHSDATLIVNTTPVGMYPENGSSPIDLSQFKNLEGVVDLIYNPSATKLLMDAQALGLKTENGLWMLVAQAKESAQWFTGADIDDTVIKQIYNKLSTQMKNIVLIGMPGSGKTTLGHLLSEATGRPLIDTDTEIENQINMPIPEFFPLYGEAAFREVETKVLQTTGKQSGMIISTGGGCVTRPENYPSLHQNSLIVWVQRDLSVLPTEGRPISMRTKAEELYRVRRPMYEAFADFTVDNNATPDRAVQTILAFLQKEQMT